MEKDIKKPAFHFLGYHIQKVNFQRLGNETVEEIKISISNAHYNEETKVYSLVLKTQIDFTESKGSKIEVLGGFKVNDSSILKNKNTINSIFSASLYPYLRTVVQNLTSDDRSFVMLPTIDHRNIDLKNGMSIKPK